MAAERELPTSGPPPPPAGPEDDAWRPEWDPQRRTDGDHDDDSPTPVPGRRSALLRTASGLLVLVLVAVAAVLLIDAGDDPAGTGQGQTVPTSGTSLGTGPGTVVVPAIATPPDPAVLAAARQVFDEVNAEAGADPARQRSVLERVVDPAHRADQQGCAAAITTVRLVPAWADVRVATDGHLIVPSLIRIFTGTRITGTDVAVIDVTISAGQATLPALCVS